jgi:hypothetical protein
MDHTYHTYLLQGITRYYKILQGITNTAQGGRCTRRCFYRSDRDDDASARMALSTLPAHVGDPVADKDKDEYNGIYVDGFC